MATLFPLRRFATPGKQCALIATGDYRPSLRSPWPAAQDAANQLAQAAAQIAQMLAQASGGTLPGTPFLVQAGQRDRIAFGFGGYTTSVAPGDVAGATAGITQSIVEQLTGISDQLKQIILTRVDFSSPTAAADIEFARAFLSGELFDPQPASEAARAIADLNAQFDQAVQTASRLGLAVDQVEQARQQQLAELTASFAAPFRDASRSLTDVIDRITLQNLKPADQLGTLQSQFAVLAAGAVSAEDLIARASQLSGLVDPLLAAGKDVYASGSGYQDLLREVVDALASVQDLLADRAAAVGSHAAGLPAVPYDGYLAELHTGEAVIDANTMRQLRRYGVGGADNGAVLAALSRIEAAVREADQPVTIRVVTADGRVLTEQTLRELRRRSEREIVVHAHGVAGA